MSSTRQWKSWLLRSAGVVAIALLADSFAMADDIEQRRLDIGLRIFPRLVAVDNHLKQRLTPDQSAVLIFAYRSQEKRARDAAERLINEVDNIAGFEASTRVVHIGEIEATEPPIAGIFICEHMNNQTFKTLKDYATSRHVLLFSPIAGDVERGATAGLFIGSRIRPYFNLETLRRSDVQINKRLLGISKHYE